MTTVDIITVQGDKIPLWLLVVPHIATPLKRQHNADINNMPHLKGFEISTSSIKWELFNQLINWYRPLLGHCTRYYH